MFIKTWLVSKIYKSLFVFFHSPPHLLVSLHRFFSISLFVFRFRVMLSTKSSLAYHKYWQYYKMASEKIDIEKNYIQKTKYIQSLLHANRVIVIGRIKTASIFWCNTSNITLSRLLFSRRKIICPCQTALLLRKESKSSV